MIDNNGNLTLADIVALLSEPEVKTDPTSYAPTSGRVVEDASDGTIYIGDGDTWYDVNAAVGLTTERVDAQEGTVATAPVDPTDIVRNQDTA